MRRTGDRSGIITKRPIGEGDWWPRKWRGLGGTIV